LVRFAAEEEGGNVADSPGNDSIHPDLTGSGPFWSVTDPDVGNLEAGYLAPKFCNINALFGIDNDCGLNKYFYLV
jgi:hypothetical protein